MNKFLLTTTAVAAMLIGTSAMADGVDIKKMNVSGVDVSVGGSLNAYGGMLEEKQGRDSNFDFLGDGKLTVSAEGVATDSLKFGAELEMYANSGKDVSVDKAWLWLGTPLAKLHFGDNDGAVNLLRVGAPSLGAGTLNSSENGRAAYWMRFAGISPLMGDNIGSGTSTKISVISERIQGFQGGVSYAPTMDRGDNILFGRDTKDILEIGANYHGAIDGIGIRAGGGYATRKELSNTVTGWNVGAGLSWNQIDVGGGFTQIDNAGTKIDEYTVGARYDFDKFSVGANYALNKTPGVNDANVYSVGTAYSLTQNLAVHGDVGMIDRKGEARNTVFTAGMRVNF
jgi:hypothetical protein